MSDSNVAAEKWLTPRALAWALYDFATSVWSITFTYRYFPLWVKDEPLGLAFAIGVSLLVAQALEFLLTPLSDATGRRRIFVTVFTLATAACTFALGNTPPLAWALALFGLANMALNVAGTFYNPMLHDVSAKQNVDRVSALGVGLAEVGIIAGLIVMARLSERGGFGLVFWSTSVILVVAALPLMLFLRERDNGARVSYREARQRAWTDLRRMAQVILGERRLRLFFYAFFFFSAALAGFGPFMAAYATKVIGLSETSGAWGVDELTWFLIAGAAFSVGGAFLGGWAATRFGDFPALAFTVAGCCAAFVIAAAAQQQWMFWVAGALTGIAFSAGRVTGRAVILKSVGAEDLSKIFAFFALGMKLATGAGLLVYSAVIKAAESQGILKYRLAVGSLAVLAAVSLWFLFGAIRAGREPSPSGSDETRV